MSARRLALMALSWTVLHRLRIGRARRRTSRQPPPAAMPSADLVLQTLTSERQQETAREGALNGTASAIIGLEAVFGTVALDVSAAPNWKTASLSVLLVSMSFAVFALTDFLFQRRGPLTYDPSGLVRYLTKPVEETRLTLIATTSGLVASGRSNLIYPKRRKLAVSLVALIVSAALLGVGAGLKESQDDQEKGGPGHAQTATNQVLPGNQPRGSSHGRPPVG
jgi:hypothetical protein